MSPYVPPDEVHPCVQRIAAAVHLHAHDGQLVSRHLWLLVFFSQRQTRAIVAASPVSLLCWQREACERIQQHARAVKD